MGFLRVEWVDIKLAFRIMARYPALTVVGVVSLSIAVAIVAGAFGVTNNLLHPTLPFDGQRRVVAVQNWDVSTGEGEPSGVQDYLTWREALSSIEELGAFATVEKEVVAESGESRSARVAEITASAFRLPGVVPLQGRPLTDYDAEAGSADVAVIGDRLAREFYAGDGHILGRTIRIGGVPHTVVGVMPESFGFPLAHSIWVPLRPDPGSRGVASDPSLSVFGRLADGATLRQAQAELSVVGKRMERRFPVEYKTLRPRVTHYGEQWAASRIGYAAVRVGLVLLLLVIGTNVGALVLARNLAREGEFAVRTALGAGRSRLVLQLTIEALLLVSFSCLAGLLMASWGMKWLSQAMGDIASPIGGLPFWWQDGLTPEILLWVSLLGVGTTFLCGTVPALMVTRFREWVGLQRFAAAGRTRRAGVGIRALIAMQFALSVGMLTMAVAQWPDAVRNEADVAGLHASSFLTAVLRPETSPSATSDRSPPAPPTSVQQALSDRLSADPDVVGVAFASALPGMVHPQGRFEVNGVGGVGHSNGYPVRYTAVAPHFFQVMGAQILAGRTFTQADFAPDGTALPVAIVNKSFALNRMGQLSAVGRRIRLASTSVGQAQWLEVVGVVQDFGMNRIDPSRPEGIYLPLNAEAYPVSLAVRTVGDPSTFAPRLRRVVAALGPSVSAVQVRSLGSILDSARRQRRIEFAAIGLGTLAVLILTLGGLSAVMSYFISNRTYEVGIRTALGAQPYRIALDIYSSALRSLGWGATIAIPGTIALSSLVLEGGSALVAAKVSIALLGIALLACVPATRRLLEVEPSAAMKADT